MPPDSSNPPLTNDLEIAPGCRLPEAALEFTFARSSGPGGQNVNKVATKALLRVGADALRAVLDAGALHRLKIMAPSRFTDEGDLLLTASDSRSQVANRKACLDKLRALLIEARRVPKVRRPTKPGKGAQLRRLQSKHQRSQTKSTRRQVGGEE